MDDCITGYQVLGNCRTAAAGAGPWPGLRDGKDKSGQDQNAPCRHGGCEMFGLGSWRAGSGTSS